MTADSTQEKHSAFSLHRTSRNKGRSIQHSFLFCFVLLSSPAKDVTPQESNSKEGSRFIEIELQN